jgi:hypothetical protein
MTANPSVGSDAIFLAVADSSSRLNSFFWNGTNWSPPHPIHSSSLENGGIEMDFDITFETHVDTIGDAWIVWADGTGVSRRLWDSQTASWQPPVSE